MSARARLTLLIAVTLVALLLGAAGAQASGILGSGVGPSVGPSLDPLPSVGELLSGVVGGLFGALLSALTPSFLKHADIDTLQWLVALPNVADSASWPTVAQLEGNMVWVAGALLPTTLIAATIRDTALSLGFRAHPAGALLRVLGAVAWLAAYRFAVANAVAFVNVLTHTILSWPLVAKGLHRTVLVLFGGSLLLGTGGAFLALLGLVALIFAVCLFALKVLLLIVLAVLFVAGPLLIALTPLPSLAHLARGWLLALIGICLVPVGWCLLFATAGAISLDVTNLGAGAQLGSRVVGAFAALATYVIAFKWPLLVLGHVRSSLGGLGVRPGTSGAGAGAASDRALAVKAQRARSGLQAAMLAGGRGVGLAAGALGAPRGGLVGAAGRAARPHLASAAASGAIAAGPPHSRPRPSAGGERIAKAGDVLRQTPGRMREAWRAAARPPAGASRSRRSSPPRSRKPRAAGKRGPTGGADRGRAPTPAPAAAPGAAKRPRAGAPHPRSAPAVAPQSGVGERAPLAGDRRAEGSPAPPGREQPPQAPGRQGAGPTSAAPASQARPARPPVPDPTRPPAPRPSPRKRPRRRPEKRDEQ